MAKLPDGYLYIPKAEGDTITVEPVEFVMCRNCANQECEGRDGQIVCGITGEAHRPDWWCADRDSK